MPKKWIIPGSSTFLNHQVLCSISSQVSTKPLLRPGWHQEVVQYSTYMQLYMCTMSVQSCSAWPKSIWMSFKTPATAVRDSY